MKSGPEWAIGMWLLLESAILSEMYLCPDSNIGSMHVSVQPLSSATLISSITVATFNHFHPFRLTNYTDYYWLGHG